MKNKRKCRSLKNGAELAGKKAKQKPAAFYKTDQTCLASSLSGLSLTLEGAAARCGSCSFSFSSHLPCSCFQFTTRKLSRRQQQAHYSTVLHLRGGEIKAPLASGLAGKGIRLRHVWWRWQWWLGGRGAQEKLAARVAECVTAAGAQHPLGRATEEQLWWAPADFTLSEGRSWNTLDHTAI